MGKVLDFRRPDPAPQKAAPEIAGERVLRWLVGMDADSSAAAMNHAQTLVAGALNLVGGDRETAMMRLGLAVDVIAEWGRDAPPSDKPGAA